jgi:hypothetical protein
VLGVDEAVAFIGVYDQLGWDVLVAQGVPELEGLWGGTFSITVAYDEEGWGLHIFDVVDGRAFGVDGGIVVNRCAEEGDHPLVDGVFAVVTEPV